MRTPHRRKSKRKSSRRYRRTPTRKDPQKLWVKVDWSVDKKPEVFPSRSVKMRQKDLLHLQVPTTRYYDTTDFIRIPTLNGTLSLNSIVNSVYDYYQQPIGSTMLESLKDVDDTFDYVASANKNTKKIELLGDMRFFEGINFTKREGNNVYYILSLGS